jgi:cysteine-rich repeat protein
VQPPEGCDDGNSQTGDGCSPSCRRIVEVVARGYFTCARLDNGALKCWGENGSGQLGQGDAQNRGDAPNELGTYLPVIDLGSGRRAVRVAAGHYHVCAILDDGAMKCWGGNSHGELGLGDKANRGARPGEMGDRLPALNLGTGRTARSMALGYDHTCAMLDNGAVKCWGNNIGGQLGLGDTLARGDEPGEMGDALSTVDLGTGRTAQWIVAHNFHTCALLDNDTLKCWGDNSSGQLGLGDNYTRGATPNSMGDGLPAVDLGTNRTAKSVTLGWSDACALLDDDSVKCWGSNGWGQHGQGDKVLFRGNKPGQMGDQLPIVRFATGRKVKSISAGWSHVCAEFDDGAIQCWGANIYGQLGLGDKAHRGDDAGETPDQLPDVPLGTGRKSKSFVAGYNHVCVIFEDDTLKCWGQSGAHGYANQLDRGDDPNELGDNLPTVLLP